MSDVKLEILLEAKNKADAAFNSIHGQIKGLTKSVFSLSGAFAGLAAGVSFAGAVRGFNFLTDAAADLEETVSKVRTLFGDELGDTLTRWAEGAADAMGLSTQAALDNAGALGHMFLQLGANREQTADLSRDMIKLSADIASFSNVSGGATQVLDAMQSAFRGEYDALQRYIPTIHAAAVQQRAMADTGRENIKQLTDLEKAIATYRLIVEGAGDATGDWDRTADSLVNQQRKLDAQLANISVKLGQDLIPAKLKMVETINEWIKNNDKLLNQDLERYFQSISDALERMAPIAATVADWVVKIMDVGAARHNNFLGRGVELAVHGLLDMEEVLNADYEALKKMVQEAEKLARISQDGKLFYRISPDTPGYPAAPTASITGGVGGGSRGGAGFAPPDTKDWELFFNDPLADQKDQLQQALDEIQADLDRFGGSRPTADDWELFFNDPLAEQKDELSEALSDIEADIDAAAAAADKAADDMQAAFAGWATGFADTLNEAVWGAEMSFSDIATSFGKMLTQMLIQKKLMEPLIKFDWGSLFPGGTTDNAHGNVYDSGGVVPFARGGVVDSPTIFPFANGIGLMGEAGPEAIMPLRRLPNGDLGVQSKSGGDVYVNVTNNTGGAVSTKRRQSERGVEIDVLIDDAVSSKMGQYGSKSNRTLRQLGGRTPLTIR